jgi:hypothetical protein
MALLQFGEYIHLRINQIKNMNNFKKIIGYAILSEIVIILLRASATNSFSPEWRDIGSVVCITFGVSPYGQACAHWVKDKFKGNKK